MNAMGRDRTRWVRVACGLAALACSAVLMAACGGSSDSASTAAGDGAKSTASAKTVTMANPFEQTGFDPIMAGPTNVDYMRPVYDTLVQSTGPSSFGPGLATSWSYDGKKALLTLELRDGVEATDGEPLDAAAVVAHFERGMAEKASPWASVFGVIDSVRADGPLGVVIQLKESVPSIVDSLSGIPGMIESPKAARAGTLRRTPVGSGPWQLDAGKTKPPSEFVYTKNADYWDPSVQLIDTLVLKVMPDTAARVNALRDGQLEATEITPKEIAPLEAQGFKTEDTDQLLWVGAVIDREGKLVPALADPRVRRALILGIDREAILTSMLGGHGEPSASVYPKGVEGHSPGLDEELAYDPVEAKRLLEEAGFGDGFSFSFYSTTANQHVAAPMAGQWQKLGVRAKLTVVDQATWQTKLAARELPVVSFAFPMQPPFALYRSYASPGGIYNPFSVTSETVDRAARELAGLTAKDADRTEEVSGDLMKAMVEDGIIIPVAASGLPTAMVKGMTGDFDHYSSILPEPRGLAVR